MQITCVISLHGSDASPQYLSWPDGSDILLNVFLAIAVDNLADADALGENEDAKDDDEAADIDAEGVVYEVRAWSSTGVRAGQGVGGRVGQFSGNR